MLPRELTPHPNLTPHSWANDHLHKNFNELTRHPNNHPQPPSSSTPIYSHMPHRDLLSFSESLDDAANSNSCMPTVGHARSPTTHQPLPIMRVGRVRCVPCAACPFTFHHGTSRHSASESEARSDRPEPEPEPDPNPNPWPHPHFAVFQK